MSNSPLVTHTRISPNKTSPRNHAIDTITIHCVVGQCTVERLGDIFAPTEKRVSSNYGVGLDGRIGMYVEEKDRSWCTSSSANDNRAITIEVASDNKEPYAVTDKAYAALIELCADICKRNGIKKLLWKADKSLIGQVDKQNMSVHRWFANKSCPGTYLYERHYDIAEKVNAILGVGTEEIIPAEESGDIIPGDLVYLVSGATFACGKTIPAETMEKRWYVQSVDGDRAVLDDGSGCPIPLKYLNTSITEEIPTVITPVVTDNAEKAIWDFLKGKGLNNYAVAGIMGNLYAESALRPNNLQNSYETSLGISDEEYTAAIDDGSYDNFIKDKAGYGLAQWTYWSRKQGLLEYAKSVNKSIGDLTMQLEYLWKELLTYTKVMSVLNAATSIQEASDIILTQYEKPANQGDTVKARRASYGQGYYDKYSTNAPMEDTTLVTTFSPRKTAPLTTDKHWVHNSFGGLNECILINGNSCLPNCVGYAWGRFYEITGVRPSLSRRNAEDWYAYTADGYERGQTPRLGAVICWRKGQAGNQDDGAGHVAIVEEIKSNGDIVTSNSNYKGTRFYTQTLTKSSGYKLGSAYTLQGFIYPPVIYGVKTPDEFTPYVIKVTADSLNIRKGAGTNYAIVGAITDHGCYTIVAESTGTGATKWGKLKSGAGWVSLDYTTKF